MQSIIVYRNPAEALFWEAMSNGDIIPIFIALFVFLVIFVTIANPIAKMWRKTKFAYNVRHTSLVHFPMILAFIVAGSFSFMAGKYFWLA